jgi:phosphoglycolate phosphatase-like HAD superfamily hydrolase
VPSPLVERSATGALGFDFDGTLVDSLAAIGDAASRAALQVGVSLDGVDLAALSALSLDDYHRAIRFESPAQFERFKATFRAAFDRESYRLVAPFDGAGDTLERAMALLGVDSVFILTNRRRESALQIIDYLRLPRVGGGVHSASGAPADAGNRKTAILRAIAARQYPQRIVLYVGDAIADMEAALAAGVVPVFCAHDNDYKSSDEHALAHQSTQAVRGLREIIQLFAPNHGERGQ